MSIELDGWVRKLSLEELKAEEQKKPRKKIEPPPTEQLIDKTELPRHCPACGAFTGGSDTCPSCEETIQLLESKR